MTKSVGEKIIFVLIWVALLLLASDAAYNILSALGGGSFH
jgi:hypothetical protein